MTNLLQDSAAWLGGQLQTAAGRTVDIRQGRQVVTGFVATLAMHDYTVADAEGFPTVVNSCDWTFVAADLIAAGITLRSGTILRETLSGEVREYEAMLIGTKECVEDLDSSGLLLTLHTKRIK